MTDHTGPLQGIRVIDLTRWVAGPSCSLMLGMLGAEVIRVESSGRAGMPDSVPEETDPGAWSELNAGKSGIQLNLKHPAGLELGKKLLATADVFLYNMRQSAADRLGLGPDVLLNEVNPGLVILCMSLSGATGMEREYLGYAPLFAGLAGLSYVSGHTDGPPCENPTWPDHELATWGAVSVVSALIERQLTGRGAFVDLSGREALAWLVGDTLVDFQQTGEMPVRYGNRHAWMAPHNCYPAQGIDRWVSIAVATDEEWHGLCQAMNMPALETDTRFATGLSRWHNQDDLDAIIAAWSSHQEAHALVARCQGLGVAAVLVNNAEDIYSSHHLWEREFFATLSHPIFGDHTMIGPPWKMSRMPPNVAGPGPAIGEHNAYVYGELLGLSGDQIEQFKRQGVIL